MKWFFFATVFALVATYPLVSSAETNVSDMFWLSNETESANSSYDRDTYYVLGLDLNNITQLGFEY